MDNNYYTLVSSGVEPEFIFSVPDALSARPLIVALGWCKLGLLLSPLYACSAFWAEVVSNEVVLLK